MIVRNDITNKDLCGMNGYRHIYDDRTVKWLINYNWHE
jgi:hypothetical protein